MKATFLLFTAVAFLECSSLANHARANELRDGSPQVIILKLDDVTAHEAPNGPPVHPRWQRVTAFLRDADIKASYGIIGFSLEEKNGAYFEWIKDLHKEGLVEFWNHGYRNRKAADKAGEFEGSWEEQNAALERTQKLAKEKLGIELQAFGPHWSGTNAATARALEDIPEITMWFYGREDSGKFVFPQVLDVGKPNSRPRFHQVQSCL